MVNKLTRSLCGCCQGDIDREGTPCCSEGDVGVGCKCLDPFCNDSCAVFCDCEEETEL